MTVRDLTEEEKADIKRRWEAGETPISGHDDGECWTCDELRRLNREETESAIGGRDEAMTECRNCDQPIRRDTRVGPNRSPTGWTHGRSRSAPDWQGKRCPGRLTGAEPKSEKP